MKKPLLILLLFMSSIGFAQQAMDPSKTSHYSSSSIIDFANQEFTTGYDLMKINNFKIVLKGENREVLNHGVVTGLTVVVSTKNGTAMKSYASIDGNYDLTKIIENYELKDGDQIIITSIRVKGEQGEFSAPGKVFAVSNRGYDTWRTDVISEQLIAKRGGDDDKRSTYKKRRALKKAIAKRKALERRKLAKLRKETLKKRKKNARFKNAELRKKREENIRRKEALLKKKRLEEEKRRKEKEKGEFIQKKIKILDTDSRQIYYFVGTVKKDSRAAFAKGDSENERVSKLLRMANIPGMVGAWVVYDKDGKVVARFQVVLSKDGKTYTIK